MVPLRVRRLGSRLRCGERLKGRAITMIRAGKILLGAGLAMLAGVSYGADAGATALLKADSAAAFQLGASAAQYAKMSTATVTGQTFSNALRIEVSKKPQRSTEVQISTKVDAAMANGDVLMVAFWMRSGSAAEATLDAGFRGAGGGGRGMGGGMGGGLNMAANAAASWKKVTFPFALTRAYNKGEAEVFFTVGMREQTVEIGGIELLNYGTTKKVAELPFTKLGYAGSEPGAAWRKAAEARIEKIRKGDLTVVVKDKAGKPVRNAEVAVHMKKHAFRFGTAVSGMAMNGTRITPENLARYKQEILRLFNIAVMENETKWPQWSVESSRPATLAAIDWLRQNGFEVRGHNLVWPSWRNTNVKAAQDAKNDSAALAKVVLDHIAETTGALKGRLIDWDVMNEPFANHDLMDILGRHAMVDWFKAARAGDPAAKLYINDYDILAGEDKAHQDDYASTIKYLIDEGAPLDGIGLQSHFPARVTPMDELMKRLDRFAAFGRELEVTEFDINTSDEATQADYTRDFMTATFSHPQVKAFLMWGFWEGAHWIPKGAMMRRDWTLKPNGEVYQDMVFKRWWTDVSGKSNSQGTFATRGFLGDYEIEVKAGGKTKTVRASLSKDGSRVDCVLE
jgi:endo-1,4-beta-xylanase